MTEPLDEQALADQLQELGCAIGRSKKGRLLRVDNRECPAPLAQALLVQILACSALREIWLRHVSGFLNDHIETIAALPRLKSLDIEGSDLTNESLRRLTGCRELQVLNVRQTRVSEACVSDLRKSMINTRIIF
ncbi:MAG: hypothetical protein ACR2NP_06875 [Pirellulaceae bacterium]